MPAASFGPQTSRPHRGLPGDAKGGFRQRLVETRVRFKRLSEKTSKPISPPANGAARPADTPPGTRGQLHRQDRRLLHQVVGLPLYETASLLSGEGFPVHFGWLNAL